MAVERQVYDSDSSTIPGHLVSILHRQEEAGDLGLAGALVNLSPASYEFFLCPRNLSFLGPITYPSPYD